MTPMIRYFLALPFFLAIVAGCSKSSQTPCSVFGKITYKGQPVTGGTVAFHRVGEDQKGSYGFTLKPDGTYEGSSMPPEEYVVTVETESINPKKPTPLYGPQGMMADGKTKMGPDAYKKKMIEMGKMPGVTEEQGTYVKIPAKYNDQTKSTLRTKKLENGKNKLDFDLTD